MCNMLELFFFFLQHYIIILQGIISGYLHIALFTHFCSRWQRVWEELTYYNILKIFLYCSFAYKHQFFFRWAKKMLNKKQTLKEQELPRWSYNKNIQRIKPMWLIFFFQSLNNNINICFSFQWTLKFIYNPVNTIFTIPLCIIKSLLFDFAYSSEMIERNSLLFLLNFPLLYFFALFTPIESYYLLLFLFGYKLCLYKSCYHFSQQPNYNHITIFHATYDGY